MKDGELRVRDARLTMDEREGRMGEGLVAVGEGELALDTERGGRVLVPRAAILRAWLDREGRAAFDIDFPSAPGRLVLEVAADQGGGAALLHRLGLSAAQTTAEFPIGSALAETGWEAPAKVLTAFTAFMALLFTVSAAGFWARVLGLLAAPPDLPGALATTALSAALLTLLVWLVRGLSGRTASVGTDAFVVRGPRARRIPLSQVERVNLGAEGIWILQAKGSAYVQTAQPDALAARIEEALATQGKSHDGAAKASLARDDESLAAWQGRVRALGLADASYRGAPADPEELLRVVEDASASKEQRVGAALALSASDAGDTEGARARMRVAAQATTDLALKVALEQAAEGEVAAAEIERALRTP